jgi:hypothetical protein
VGVLPGPRAAWPRSTLTYCQAHLREIDIHFLRRLFGGGQPDIGPEAQSSAADTATSTSESVDTGELRATPTAGQSDAAAACPYCAGLLDPAPQRGRLCPRCRRPIVVRRVAGRRVLLTKEALDVFEVERDRQIKERRWTRERQGWLALAKGVSAPVNRIERLGARRPSEAVVAASKDLYLAAAERAARTARREKNWSEVARIRRGQAAALYRESGSAVPPPDEVVALHRAWSAAALRSLVGFGSHVELVAAGCCATCEIDNGRVFRITAELRAQRLPHTNCPKGLCPCDWWPVPDAKALRKRRVRRPASPGAGPVLASVADPAAGPVSPVESDPVSEPGLDPPLAPEGASDTATTPRQH